MKKFETNFEFDSEKVRTPVLKALKYIWDLPLILQIVLALACLFTPAPIVLALLVAVLYDGIWGSKRLVTPSNKTDQ